MAYYKNYESSTPGSMQGNQWPVWPKPPVIQIGLARHKYLYYGTHEEHNDEVVYVCSRGIQSKAYLSRPDQPRLYLWQAKAGNWVAAEKTGDGSFKNMTPFFISCGYNYMNLAPWGEWLQFGGRRPMWFQAKWLHRGCDIWWAEHEWRKHDAGSKQVFTGVLDDVPHFYAPPEYTESLFKDAMHASGEKVMMESSWQ